MKRFNDVTEEYIDQHLQKAVSDVVFTYINAYKTFMVSQPRPDPTTVDFMEMTKEILRLAEEKRKSPLSRIKRVFR